MHNLFFEKLKYYKKKYFIKAIILFLLFFSVNTISLIAVSYTNIIYHQTNIYEKDVYYSNMFTNINEDMIQDTRNYVESENFSLTYDVHDSRNGSKLLFTSFYEGNIDYGIGLSDRVMVKPSVKTNKMIPNGTAIVSNNYNEDTVTLSGIEYKVSAKTSFEVPPFFDKQYRDYGAKDASFAFICKPFEASVDNTNKISFLAIDANEETAQKIGHGELYLGKELSNNYEVAMGGISTLMYLAFAIPYCFALVIWTALIRMTDTISRNELGLFRSFGYPKNKAKALYFFENVFLSLPGLVLSLIIFVPIFIVLSPNATLLPVVMSFVGLLYYFLFSIVYTQKTIGRIYKKSEL